MTTVKDVLSGAYTLVKAGWTKGLFFEQKRGRACFCAMGAINKAATGNAQGFVGNDPFSELRNAAIRILYEAIYPRGRGSLMAVRIVDFNDKKTTTKQDITKAFRTAIAKAA